METLFNFTAAADFVKTKLGKATGLPWDLRDGQREALAEIFEAFGSGLYDNVIVVAPTGSGKSGIAMGVAEAARMQGERTTLLTPTRLLQEQVVADFAGNKSLRAIQGRANYCCNLYKNMEVEGAAVAHTAVSAPCQPFGTVINPERFLRDSKTLAKDPKTLHPDQDRQTRSAARTWLEKGPHHRGLDRREFLETPGEDGQQRSEKWVDKAMANWQSGYQVKFCASRGLCSYLNARAAAEAAPTVQMNLKGYFAWNTFAREAPFFKPRTFTVFDECHVIEDYARDFYSFQASAPGLNKLFNDVMGQPKDGEWVQLNPSSDPTAVKVTLEGVMELTKSAIAADMQRLGITSKFDLYADLHSEDAKSNGAKLIRLFKVVKAALDPDAKYAQEVLDPKDNKVSSPTLYLVPADLPNSFRDVYGMFNVFMSATIADAGVFCDGVRIDRKRTKIVRLKDTFPVEHRPIIPMPVASVTTKNIKADPEKVYGALAKAVDVIAQRHPDKKILIHTNSYVFGQEIMSRVALTTIGRLLCPANGAENKQMIEEYKATSNPSVLMTPACKEGYDFKDDLCRVQIFLKCPFPSPYDPVVRLKSKAWYFAKVATALRQQYGRSTRTEKDFSVTYFLDARIIEFVEKHHKLFPSEFHQAMGLGKTLDWEKLEITTQLSIDGEKVSY